MYWPSLTQTDYYLYCSNKQCQLFSQGSFIADNLVGFTRIDFVSSVLSYQWSYQSGPNPVLREARWVKTGPTGKDSLQI